jgi:hypothetical protein
VRGPFGQGTCKVFLHLLHDVLRYGILWGIDLEQSAAFREPTIALLVALAAVRLHRSEAGIVLHHNGLKKVLELHALALVASFVEDETVVVKGELRWRHVRRGAGGPSDSLSARARRASLRRPW